MHFYLLDHEATLEDIKTFNYPNQKIGVIVNIENNKGEILLQRRGKKSRDENEMYEAIGGKVDEKDSNFKSAILREIKEEAGSDINLEFSPNNGIYHCYKYNTNWIFIIYFAKYLSGNFKIMEPSKCLGYKFFTYEEIINSQIVTESYKYLIKSIKNEHQQVDCN